MNTLNWEKLPTFKANKTIWMGGDTSATSSLQAMLGGKTLNLDVDRLEGMFAKPDIKPRVPLNAGDEKPKTSKVTLLDAKRSTSVGIVMKRITDALQGKELRDALMEVDENVLPLDVLPMVLEIVPSAEERKCLLDYTGDASSLDKPEQMLRTLSHIPRLEGRLRAMMFKCQLEVDMDGVLMQQVDDLKVACDLVRESKELHALMQVVLDVGNALNAGTAKGNAVGFKLSTLLKLADLKAMDKKATLLHFVVDVVQASAPEIVRVIDLQKAVREASRVSIEELTAKKRDAERGLAQVDQEITWHDEQRLRSGEAAEDDQFPEIFTEFFNWAAERKEHFDEELEKATALFASACELMGESDAKEPADLFDTLEKFIRRFEAVNKEIEEAKKAELDRRPKATPKGPAKKLRNPRPSMGIPMPGKISIKRAVPTAAAEPGTPAIAADGDTGAMPQRRNSHVASKNSSHSSFVSMLSGKSRKPAP